MGLHVVFILGPYIAITGLTEVVYVRLSGFNIIDYVKQGFERFFRVFT